MTRWNQEALSDALRLNTPAQFPEFHALWPDFSYDAWEVKRRRVAADSPMDAGLLQRIAVADTRNTYVGPRILFYDFETTYSSQPRMLSAASVDGQGNETVFDLRDYGATPGTPSWLDDRAMCLAIRDHLESVEIICGWNSKLFDVPVLNGRLAFYGERPLRAQMHLDLMYYATGSFMRIGRKSLESVSTFFDSPNRKTPLSVRIWDRADHGSVEDYELILEHNIADVWVTRDVYPSLSPHIRTLHRAG